MGAPVDGLLPGISTVAGMTGREQRVVRRTSRSTALLLAVTMVASILTFAGLAATTPFPAAAAGGPVCVPGTATTPSQNCLPESDPELTVIASGVIAPYGSVSISIATGFPACAGPEDIDCVVEVENPGSQACFGMRHGNPDRAGGCVYGGGNRTEPPAGVERITYSSAHGDTCEGRRNFSPSGWTLEQSWSSVAAALMDCTLTLNYGWDGVGEHPTFVSFERQIRVRRERTPNGSFGENTYTAWSNYVPAGPTRTSSGFFACQGSVQERNGLYEIYFFSTSTYLEPYAIRDGAGSDRDLLEVVSITPPPGVTPDYDFLNSAQWNLDYKGLSQSWSGKVATPGRYSMTYRVYVNGGE